MRWVRTFYIAVVLISATFCQARDLAVVVNKSNSTTSLSAADLQKLLKAVTSTWPDGRRVRIFLTDSGSAENRSILQRFYEMAPGETKNLQAHKADIQIVGSDEIVLTMVNENPGAIGLVNVYSITSQVKVLKVDGKLPLEPGYPLHGN
jgi:ABC-type phosphate transport system substrate-binding protein